MKGKSSFNKREVELIESLILQRCNADKSLNQGDRSLIQAWIKTCPLDYVLLYQDFAPSKDFLFHNSAEETD